MDEGLLPVWLEQRVSVRIQGEANMAELVRFKYTSPVNNMLDCGEDSKIETGAQHIIFHEN